MNDNLAKPGEKVMFLAENGYHLQLVQASKIFELGQVLVVEETNIGSFSSTYKFKNHKNHYNTVMFERLS